MMRETAVGRQRAHGRLVARRRDQLAEHRHVGRGVPARNRGGRLAHQERAVVAQQHDGAVPADADLAIERHEIGGVDIGDDEAGRFAGHGGQRVADGEDVFRFDPDSQQARDLQAVPPVGVLALEVGLRQRCARSGLIRARILDHVPARIEHADRHNLRRSNKKLAQLCRNGRVERRGRKSSRLHIRGRQGAIDDFDRLRRVLFEDARQPAGLQRRRGQGAIMGDPQAVPDQADDGTDHGESEDDQRVLQAAQGSGLLPAVRGRRLQGHVCRLRRHWGMLNQLSPHSLTKS